MPKPFSNLFSLISTVLKNLNKSLCISIRYMAIKYFVSVKRLLFRFLLSLFHCVIKSLVIVPEVPFFRLTASTNNPMIDDFPYCTFTNLVLPTKFPFVSLTSNI